MNKKLFFSLFITLSLFCSFYVVPSSTFAAETTQNKSDLEKIDEELKTLYLELKSYRKLTMNEELEAQEYFRFKPEEYLEKVQKDEVGERKIAEIKEKIKILQTRKIEIQRSTTTSNGNK